MNAQLDAVFVHYFSGPWLPAAVRALRADWARDGLTGRIIVVDNGSTPCERADWAGLELIVLDGGGNRGFAAGVNRGVAAGDAPALLLVNPDVEVRPGCTRRLLEALHHAPAAGPRFFWDADRTFLLPPTEPVDRLYRLLDRAATRSPAARRHIRARWRRHARRHWRARDPLPSDALSGALLAMRRTTWTQVGPFDEGYFLFFEETDWLQRLRRAAGPGLYRPDAEAIHFFAKSTDDPAAARGHFESSARRFYTRWHGPWFTALAERLSAGGPARPDPAPAAWDPRHAPLVRPSPGDAWIELSPLAAGRPAAGHWWPRDAGMEWRMPAAVWDNLQPGAYSVIITDEQDVERAHYGFEKPAPH